MDTNSSRRNEHKGILEAATIAICQAPKNYRSLANRATELGALGKTSIEANKDDRIIRPLLLMARHLAEDPEFLPRAIIAYMDAAHGADSEEIEQAAVDGFTQTLGVMADIDRIESYRFAATYSSSGSKLGNVAEREFFELTEGLPPAARKNAYRNAICAAIPDSPFVQKAKEKLCSLEAAMELNPTVPTLDAAQKFLRDCQPH